MTANLLTLCLIARDEEAFLPRCLESVRGVADRVVVVDTGSTDRTAEIAREHGAIVVRHEWDDDFAAARNAALEHVSEGYVLVLDADEVLAPGAGAVLRRAVRKGQCDYAMMPLYNASSVDAPPDDVLAGPALKSGPVQLARLFRYLPDLKWEGIVHENVQAWAQRHKRSAELPEAAIVHYGAVDSVRESKGKQARNLRLLEKRCFDEGRPDPMALCYLCFERQNAGDARGAREAARMAWEALVERRDGGEIHHDIVFPMTQWVTRLLSEGNLAEAGAVIGRALDWGIDHPNLWFLSGRLEECRWLADGGRDQQDARLKRARELYERCLSGVQLAREPYAIDGVNAWRARTRLGTVDLLAGRFESALEAFDATLAERPNEVAARLGRIEALWSLGRAEEAFGEIEPLLHPSLPDGWALGALCGMVLGGFEAIAPVFERCRQIAAEHPFLEPHRRHYLAAIGDHASKAA
jgi:tetratricopeptide (TPR) repeat protein